MVALLYKFVKNRLNTLRRLASSGEPRPIHSVEAERECPSYLRFDYNRRLQ
jgi:hypothetical protein